MAASEDEAEGAAANGVEQVKQTTEEKGKSVRDKQPAVEDKGKSFKDKAVEFKEKGQEKLAPVVHTVKEKIESKRPTQETKEHAKDTLEAAKHTVSNVVKQESRDVVEGVKRLARDEDAFANAAHKVAQKVITGGKREDHPSGSGGGGEEEQPTHTHFAHHVPDVSDRDFSDFSEMEEEDDGEGTSDKQGHSHHRRQQQEQQDKRKKSPLSMFKAKGKAAGGGHDQHQHQQNQASGLFGTVKSVFGQGGGEMAIDKASSLAQKKLGHMRHVVDAQMDETGVAAAEERKTQGLGLVQSFVCLCTCASSVSVSG